MSLLDMLKSKETIPEYRKGSPAMNYQKEVRILFGEQLVLTLATSASNRPWACDLMFVHDEELNIYWKSSIDTQHSKNIAQNPEAAATITSIKRHSCGVQLRGKVRVADSTSHSILDEKLRVKRALTCVAGIVKREERGEIGREWYVLKPGVIYYMDGASLGYQRRKLNLREQDERN